MSGTETEEAWTGELAVRTMVPDIEVCYSNDRPPEGGDYSKATQQAISFSGDDGADFYITGDMAMAKKEGDKHYFYLLGRTKDLFSMLSSENRGMGIEDYKRRCAATAVMFRV